MAQQIAIGVKNALEHRKLSESAERVSEQKSYLEEEIRAEQDFEDIVGSSPVLREVLQQVETVAPTDSTVLIEGETGTGKELIARAIHDRSSRRERTFVKINCAAIPMGLLESELFGQKGAPLPERSHERSGASNWLIKARCSWMRSATFLWSCNLSCCGFFRNKSSSAWVAISRSASMFA